MDYKVSAANPINYYFLFLSNSIYLYKIQLFILKLEIYQICVYMYDPRLKVYQSNQMLPNLKDWSLCGL